MITLTIFSKELIRLKEWLLSSIFSKSRKVKKKQYLTLSDGSRLKL